MALSATETAAPELIAARLMASRKGAAGLHNNKDLPRQLKDALGEDNEVVVTISLDVKGHKIHIGEFDGYVPLGNMTVKRKRYDYVPLCNMTFKRKRYGWMDNCGTQPQFKHYSLIYGDESVDLFMVDIRIDMGWEEQFNLQRQRAVVRILTEGVTL